MLRDRHLNVDIGGSYMVEIVGDIGLGMGVQGEDIRKWFNGGILDRVTLFEDFVVDNYKLYNWGTFFEENEELRAALFARMLLGLYLQFEKNENGRCLRNERFFNGQVLIPKVVEGGKISVLASDYFSRFAFLSHVKGKSINTSQYLINFREFLDVFDKANEEELLRLYSGEVTLQDILSKHWVINFLGLQMMVKVGEEYLYVKRGKVNGEGKFSCVTGIVDKVDIGQLVEEELKEELGVEPYEIKSRKFLGMVVNDNRDLVLSTLGLDFKYLIELDICKKDLLERHGLAEDNYENSGIYFTDDVEVIRELADENKTNMLKIISLEDI